MNNPVPALLILAATIIAIGALAGFWWKSGSDNNIIALAPDKPELVAAGELIYSNQCASCHGKNLEGQPDWKTPLPNGRYPAPPHDASGHTWHHTDELLFQLTKFGSAAVVGNGHQSDMPGFRDILSDRQIIAVLSFIKSTWPQKIRDNHDLLNKETRARQGN